MPEIPEYAQNAGRYPRLAGAAGGPAGREIVMFTARIFAVSAIVAVLSACASAPPAPADYRTVLTAPCINPADDTPWLTVATWDDGDVYRQMTRFQSDGVMPYAYENDPESGFDNARWSIDGAALKFDMNDHYADYEGTFDGKSARGTMKNVAGNHGTWVMERACAG